MTTNKRRFIRQSDFPGIKGEVYIVYKYETKRLESEGTYDDSDIAAAWMRDLLAQGICAWVVSYDA